MPERRLPSGPCGGAPSAAVELEHRPLALVDRDVIDLDDHAGPLWPILHVVPPQLPTCQPDDP